MKRKVKKNEMWLYDNILKYGLAVILGIGLGFFVQWARADLSVSSGVGNSSTLEVSVITSFKDNKYKAMASYWNYEKPTVAVSGMVKVISLHPVNLYFGGALISDTNDVNGTHLNFIIRPEIRLTPKMGVFLTHYSNGRKLGIGPEDKVNKGWNFIGVEYSF